MEYWSKRLITDGLIFLEVNKDAAIFFLEGSEDEDRNENNEYGGGGEVSWHINASNILHPQVIW